MDDRLAGRSVLGSGLRSDVRNARWRDADRVLRRRVIVALVVGVVLASAGTALAQSEPTVTSQGNSAGYISATWNMTTAAGSDRMAIVQLALSDTSPVAPTGVTYGTVSLAQVGTTYATSDFIVQQWACNESCLASASSDVVLVQGGTYETIIGLSETYDNVNQANPYPNNSIASGLGGSMQEYENGGVVVMAAARTDNSGGPSFSGFPGVSGTGHWSGACSPTTHCTGAKHWGTSDSPADAVTGWTGSSSGAVVQESAHAVVTLRPADGDGVAGSLELDQSLIEAIVLAAVVVAFMGGFGVVSVAVRD